MEYRASSLEGVMRRALLAFFTAAACLITVFGDAVAQSRFSGAFAGRTVGRMQVSSGGLSRTYRVVPTMRVPLARLAPIGEQRVNGAQIAAAGNRFAWHRVGPVGQTSSLGIIQSSVIPGSGMNRIVSNPQIGMSGSFGGDHGMRWQRVGSSWQRASVLGNHSRIGMADPFFFRRRLWVNGAIGL